MASLHENTKITKTENKIQNPNPKLELKTFNPRLEFEPVFLDKKQVSIPVAF
jgi:hypothetical protein